MVSRKQQGCDRRGGGYLLTDDSETNWETSMKLVKNMVSFLKKEDGPTAVEYAVMLALIVVVCIAAITALGGNANSTFSTVSSATKPAAS